MTALGAINWEYYGLKVAFIFHIFERNFMGAFLWTGCTNKLSMQLWTCAVIQTENQSMSWKVVDSIYGLWNFSTPNKSSSEMIRHDLSRETFTPIYTALVQQNNKKRNFTDITFGKGFAISYNNIHQLSWDLARYVNMKCGHGGVLCRTPHRTGMWTIANSESKDHHPSSTSTSDAFHGMNYFTDAAYITTLNSGTLRKCPQTFIHQGWNIVRDHFTTIATVM